MKKLIAYLFWRNQLLRPIVSAITAEALFMFIVLVGIFPAINDLSLIFVDQLSHLQVLRQGPEVLQGFLDQLTISPDILSRFSSTAFILPLLLTPVALYLLIFKIRRLWYVVGILPSLSGLVLLGMVASGQFAWLTNWSTDNAEEMSRLIVVSQLLATFYRVSFFFFLCKGHLRSPAFVFSAVLGMFLLPVHHMIMYLVVAIVLRVLYVAIAQNVMIFREISAFRLGYLLVKSLVVWSPLLLLSIPHYYITKTIKDVSEAIVYEPYTFIKRSGQFTTLTFEDLKSQFNPDLNPGHVEDMLQATQSQSADNGTPSLEFDLSVVDTARIQSDMWAILEYLALEMHEGRLEVNDYTDVSKRFRTLCIANAGGPRHIEPAEFFVIELISANLNRIEAKKQYFGESEIALDVQLALHDYLKARQNEANEQLNAEQLKLDAQVQSQTTAVRRTVADIHRRTDSLASDLQQMNTDKEQDVKDAIARKIALFKLEVEDKLEQTETNLTDEIDKIQQVAMSNFHQAVPARLQDIDERLGPGVGNTAPGFIDIKTRAKNMAADFIRRILCNAYLRFRSRSELLLMRQSANAELAATKQLRELLAEVRTYSDAQAQALEQEANSLATAVASNNRNKINEATQRIHAKTDEAVKPVELKLEEAKQFAEKANKRIQHETGEAVNAITQTTKQAMMVVHYYTRLAELMTTMGFVCVVVATYFYVFSRVGFGSENPLFVTLREGKKRHDNGTLIQRGRVYTIPADHTETFYVSRRYRPTGRAPRIVIPQWPTSIAARILTGTYFMNQVSVRKRTRKPVDFRTVEGAEFVEWQLCDGEEIIFNYGSLVAMTDTVRLSTALSLRFTTLVMGRPFFYVAKGPGTMVFMTKGKAIINDDDHLDTSVSVDRILAWQKSAIFSTESELNLFDIFLSDLYLTLASDDLVVIDADPGTNKENFSKIRMLLKFFIPF